MTTSNEDMPEASPETRYDPDILVKAHAALADLQKIYRYFMEECPHELKRRGTVTHARDFTHAQVTRSMQRVRNTPFGPEYTTTYTVKLDGIGQKKLRWPNVDPNKADEQLWRHCLVWVNEWIMKKTGVHNSLIHATELE